jgi:chromosome segregation ATPase
MMATNGAISSDLDDRIAAVVAATADGVKSTAIADLITEAEAAAARADTIAQQARRRALDPRLAAKAVVEARQQADDAAFRRDRLAAAVAHLRDRLKEVKEREENDRRRIAYNKIKAERDQLAAELRANYPAIESQLEQIIGRIEVNDREIEFVNAHGLPTGAERLRSAELVAREVEGWRVDQTNVVRLTHELTLPAFKHDPHRPFAWPRSRLV